MIEPAATPTPYFSARYRTRRPSDDVHRARDRERAGDAEPDGNRAQPVRAIEVEILTGIQHVEPADPGADRRREQPRLPPAAAADRQPSADRRDRHRQPQKQLRPG